ncbi:MULTISPECIES: tryptophan synthase subunit alpha [unclassified Iodidimonas]|uniref:tryptophan synthase subunit alpha n=1 Tax=unclassified Iodidimonas TaxID=2626145 RepID=UPI002482A518|nr:MULTISPECIES: tryptophan synthase subunit alpha [unclassified Iodidimonas]
MKSRLDQRFQSLKEQKRGGLITFITAGDPDPDTSARLLARLPAAGADIIELGMPFSDPMADGPAIQESSLRALEAGMTLRKTLKMVEDFRGSDQDTPIILMGYFNPIMAFGVDAFIEEAARVGVDGLILVDLPPEEDREVREPAAAVGMALIRLATPTTDAGRLPRVLENAAGFIYYVSIAGVTGTAQAKPEMIDEALAAIRAAMHKTGNLPLAVGFGIKTADDVRRFTQSADAAVVGSAIVQEIKAHLDDEGRAKATLLDAVTDFVHSLAMGTRPQADDRS